LGKNPQLPVRLRVKIYQPLFIKCGNREPFLGIFFKPAFFNKSKRNPGHQRQNPPGDAVVAGAKR